MQARPSFFTSRALRRGEATQVDGIDLHALTQDQTVEHVMTELDQGRGGLVLTANVDIMFRLRQPANADVLAGATLIVPDGMPVVWASWLQGTPLPERVTGADLVWDLSRAAAGHGRTVFLLGAGPGVAERAGAEFERQYPGLRVVGHECPPIGFDKDPAYMADLVSRMQQLAPDLCYVALGFPKQERVALTLLQSLPRTWFMGCGGALDMAAGEVRRAHPPPAASGRGMGRPAAAGTAAAVASLPARRPALCRWPGGSKPGPGPGGLEAAHARASCA